MPNPRETDWTRGEIPEVKIDEEVREALEFFEVHTYHGSVDRLQRSLVDIVKKWHRLGRDRGEQP